MATARYYVADKNPDEAHLPGVPLADLDEEQYASYPDWLQRSIDACDFYQKTKPRASSEAPAASPVKEGTTDA